MREIQQTGGISKQDPSWADEFRRALSGEDLALSTVRAYCGDLTAFFRWYAPHSVRALSTKDLIRYRQHLSEERGLGPASVNRKLEALRRFCRWAHQRGRLPSNVAAEVKVARPLRGPRPAGLTMAEAQGGAARRRSVCAWTGQTQLCPAAGHATSRPACRRSGGFAR